MIALYVVGISTDKCARDELDGGNKSKYHSSLVIAGTQMVDRAKHELLTP